MLTQRQQSGFNTLTDVSCGNINWPTHTAGDEEHLLPRDSFGLSSTSDSRQGHNVTTNRAKSWECADCGMTFLQSKLLATHARDTKHKAYRCSRYPTCAKAFGMRTAASRHEANHSASMNHACSQCGKRFRRRDHCLEHDEICSSLPLPTPRREPTSTSDLSARAPISAQMSGEEIFTHSDTFASTSATENAWPCVDTMPPDRSSLEYLMDDNDLERSHPTELHTIKTIRQIPSDTTSTGGSVRQLSATRYVTPEGQQFDYLRTCSKCNLHFESYLEFEKHIREHHPTRSAATSQQCDDGDLSRSSVAPAFNQKDARIWGCNLCPMSFKRAYTLREHIRTHLDDRMFACFVCNKKFLRHQERKRHEALHRGVKDFVCRKILESGAVSGCGRKFSRAEALKRHSQSKAARTCSRPFFLCSGTLGSGVVWGCGRKFARADALHQHSRSELGRSCLKPVFDDEEAARRGKASLEELDQAQAVRTSGPMTAQSHTNAPFVLPAALLRQYPAFDGLDDFDPPAPTPNGEEAYSHISLFGE